MKPRLAGSSLRLTALLLLGALIVGAGLVFLGIFLHARQEARHAGALRSEAEAALAARQAPAKLQADRRQAELYRRVLQGGFLGAEDRAGWVTALGQARAHLRLASLSWRLSPRTPSARMPGLWVSAMDISADGVDKDGLEALLGYLRAHAPGRFTVESCALAFSPDGVSGQAECRLQWWTWDDATRPRD